MLTRFEEFVSASQSISSADALTEIYVAAVEREGFQNAVLARAHNNRLVDIPWTRLPRGYSESYVANGWDKIDPVMQCVHSTRRPFAWDDVCRRSGLTPRQQIFIQECRELGVHSGITIPLHGPGADADLVSLSLRDETSVDRDRLPLVYGLTVQYRLRLGDFLGEAKVLRSNLTSKEVECLRWCRDGKTNWEIGEIMGISEKTVEFHLSNAIRKLGASNRITAVVKGIQCGVISL